MLKLKEVNWAAQPELSTQSNSKLSIDLLVTLISDSMLVIFEFCQEKIKLYVNFKYFLIAIGFDFTAEGITISVVKDCPFSDW